MTTIVATPPNLPLSRRRAFVAVPFATIVGFELGQSRYRTCGLSMPSMLYAVEQFVVVSPGAVDISVRPPT